jgi:aminotransferase
VTGDFPNADYAADYTLNIPIHQSLTDEDLKFIIEKVSEFDNLFCK